MQDFVVRPGSLPPVNSWISQETLGVHMFYTVFSRFLLGRPGFPGGGPSRISLSVQMAHLLEIHGFPYPNQEVPLFLRF